MISPRKFSELLNGKQAGGQDGLRALLKAYPYFWPAGMLLARDHGADAEGEGEMLRASLYGTAPQRALFRSRGSAPASGISGSIDEAREEPAQVSGVQSVPESLPLQTTPPSEPIIAHALEHDPLEDAVAQTFGAEQGSNAANAASVATAEEEFSAAAEAPVNEPPLQRLFTTDYFSHQGVPVAYNLPSLASLSPAPAEEEGDRGLMVVRSFAEWMQHLQRSSRHAQEEAESKRAVRAMWQKEKLAAALEEEPDEIPEEVFQMAVASIAPDGVVSESLAEILAAQGKRERAVEMYRKLSAQEPAKSAYFARKIEALEAHHVT